MAEIGNTNVHVQINGITFGAIYEVRGSRLELTSADFGEQSAELDDLPSLAVAEKMLRSMAERAIRSSEALFLRDDGTAAAPIGEPGEPGADGTVTVA